MYQAILVVQQTLDMIEETRQERPRLIELIRTSQETIERSLALIKRLDVILTAADNPVAPGTGKTPTRPRRQLD